jgi:VWFA-related protein
MMRSRTVGVFALAALLSVPSAGQQSQTAGRQQQPQPSADQQRPPVFRAGTNLVQVDAFPSRDGRIVEGLTAVDFEILEDGRPQTIEDVQFIRVELNTPIGERLDPGTQAEGNQLAADPRNRVFVIYLDHYHIDLAGSRRTRRPLVDMLHRLLTPRDLFGVMTPLLRSSDLIFGRRTETLEEQLAEHWAWGAKPDPGMPIFPEPHEEPLMQCYGRGADELIRRLRQERVLQGLKALAAHLGRLREARTVLLLFTSGWKMYQPDASGSSSPARPGIGVDPRGRLTTRPTDGSPDMARCNVEAARLRAFDTAHEIRDLLDAANRNNVSFYPVNPAGLETPEVITGGNTPGSIQRQFDDIRDRWQLLLTLAGSTDGIAVGSNDMAADLRRVVDDVSAYYLLSYYSTNSTMDGKYRRIEVKMKAPGVAVKARRGYLAPVAGPGSAGRAVEPATPRDVEEALAALTRLRPATELYSYAVAMPREIAVGVELPAGAALTDRWASGGDAQVTVTDASGDEVGRASGRIAPPRRGILLRVALPAGGRGSWAVATRVDGAAGSIADRIEVPAATEAAIVGQPLLFRARPPMAAPVSPAANPVFRRTERLHVEWPIFAAADRREARVLGRNGAPLAIPLAVAERDVNGQAMLSIDLNLAPLTEGDYLIELTVGRAGVTERRLAALRVVR